MADVDISYKGNVIASMNDSGTTTLETAGMYCEDDITIAYTKSGGGGGGSAKTVSITLAYGQHTSNFVSFTIYETTDGVKGQQIGSIASADGSTTVTVSASANGFVCELRGGYIMVSRDAIYSGIFDGAIGVNVISESSGNVDIFYVCASDGRIQLDWIDWDD